MVHREKEVRKIILQSENLKLCGGREYKPKEIMSAYLCSLFL